MSVEAPEAAILAEQMARSLSGKQVEELQIGDCTRLQRSGMVDPSADFSILAGGHVDAVSSHGNCLLLHVTHGANLIIGPEYGGRVLLHPQARRDERDPHLALCFADGSRLTVRLTGMGHLHAEMDEALERVYVYRRDFCGGPSPLDADFTVERFLGLLEGEQRRLKAVLTGRDAVVVGLSNSGFQDVAFRSGLHPNRTMSDVRARRRRGLYDAITLMCTERLRLGGKEGFIDLFGNPGSYEPTMGPRFRDRSCPRCDTAVERVRAGGGYAYFCPTCQT